MRQSLDNLFERRKKMGNECCRESGFPIGIERLTSDLREAARTMSAAQARYLVDYYYQMQDDRIRSKNQGRAAKAETTEPTEWIDWVSNHLVALENRIKSALDNYSDNQEQGRWARSITGIGPVLTAGLLAHIDISRSKHAGALWRYAGLDPTIEWLGKDKADKLVRGVMGKATIVDNSHIIAIASSTNRLPENIRRLAIQQHGDKELTKKDGDLGFSRDDLIKTVSRQPWNARLKVLTWKVGESFVKVQNREGGEFYGDLYIQRKDSEEMKNAAGEFKEQALAAAKRVSKSSDAYKHYSKGFLSPGHIHSRAKRWVTKIFLCHYFEVGYEIMHGKPPDRPWVIVHGDHSDYIKPPNW